MRKRTELVPHHHRIQERQTPPTFFLLRLRPSRRTKLAAVTRARMWTGMARFLVHGSASELPGPMLGTSTHYCVTSLPRHWPEGPTPTGREGVSRLPARVALKITANRDDQVWRSARNAISNNVEFGIGLEVDQGLAMRRSRSVSRRSAAPVAGRELEETEESRRQGLRDQLGLTRRAPPGDHRRPTGSLRRQWGCLGRSPERASTAC